MSSSNILWGILERNKHDVPFASSSKDSNNGLVSRLMDVLTKYPALLWVPRSMALLEFQELNVGLRQLLHKGSPCETR